MNCVPGFGVSRPLLQGMKSLHCFGTFLPVCWVSECLNIYVPEYSLLSYLEMFPESEVTVLFLVVSCPRV